jgi:hypothetical protein
MVRNKLHSIGGVSMIAKLPFRFPVSWMAAFFLCSMAAGPAVSTANAQFSDARGELKAEPNVDIWATGGLPSLQGSYQGHPTATKCTGILAGLCAVPPGSPAGTAATFSFYTMTTFIPTGIAYGTPVIPNATVGHGRWSQVYGNQYLLRGQIYVLNNGQVAFRGITQEYMIVNSTTTYVANFAITVYDINDTGLTTPLGSISGVSHNTRLDEPNVATSPAPPSLQ